jgi:hypothetical protein
MKWTPKGIVFSLVRVLMRDDMNFLKQGGVREAKYPPSGQRILGVAILFLIIFISLSGYAFSQTNGLAIGYGLGNLNPHEDFGKIPHDLSHEFLYLSYFHGFRLSQNGQFVLEPFISYVYRTLSGFELGVNLLYQYHFWKWNASQNSLFFNIGTGGVYTSVDYTDQGSDLLFILQAGLGLKMGKYFIESRHRHYSNGGTARPNVGIETEFLSVGFYY